MIFRNDANFSGSRVFREKKTARGNVKPIEQFQQGFAIVVITDEARQSRPSTERSEAASDVSSTTRTRFALVNFGDRNRRVRTEFV